MHDVTYFVSHSIEEVKSGPAESWIYAIRVECWYMTDEDRIARQESVEGNDLPDAAIAEVFDAYERVIPLPKAPGVKPWILCVVGLVGAGKTTVVKPVSERLGLARVSSDELRVLLRDRGYNFLRTRELAKMLIEKYLRQGFGVSIDADNVDPEHQAILQKAADAAQIPIIRIHINPPEAFILDKLQNRIQYVPSGILENADAAIANYFRRKPLHEKYLSLITFDWVFDTSKDNLARQIDDFVTAMHGRGF